MKVNTQLEVMAAVPPRKKRPVSIEQEVGSASESEVV